MSYQVREDGFWSLQERCDIPQILLKCDDAVKNPNQKIAHLNLHLASRTLTTLDSTITGVEGGMPGCLHTRSHPEVFRNALTFWDYQTSMQTLRDVKYVESEIKTSMRTVPVWLYHADLLADILQHCNPFIIRAVKNWAPCDASLLLTVLELMDDGEYEWLCWNKTETLRNAMQKPELRGRYNDLDPKFFKHVMLQERLAKKGTFAQGKRPRLLLS